MRPVLVAFACISLYVSVQALRQSLAIHDAVTEHGDIGAALSIPSPVGLEERPRYAILYAAQTRHPNDVLRAEEEWQNAPKGPMEVGTIAMFVELYRLLGREDDARRMVALGKTLAPNRPEWANSLTNQP